MFDPKRFDESAIVWLFGAYPRLGQEGISGKERVVSEDRLTVTLFFKFCELGEIVKAFEMSVRKEKRESGGGGTG